MIRCAPLPSSSSRFLLSAALLFAACGGGRPSRPGGGGTGSNDGGTSDAAEDAGMETDGGGTGMGDGGEVDASSGQCDKMDILFVVDDSGSMSEEQGNLANNFPEFVSVLNDFRTEEGRPIDYRIGVTTTGRDGTYIVHATIDVPGFPPTMQTITEDMDGDNGALRPGTDCGMSVPFLSRSDDDVASKFSCLADVGTRGPSVEMPLLMTQWAVRERVSDGTNADFLRDDALLAVVILTDEDDCSRTDDPIVENITVSGGTMPMAASDGCNYDSPALVPLAEILGTLDSVKGDRARWAVAVIAGPGPGTCSSAFGEAAEAIRLKQFVTETGENAVFSSICEGDLASALRSAMETFQTACENFVLI